MTDERNPAEATDDDDSDLNPPSSQTMATTERTPDPPSSSLPDHVDRNSRNAMEMVTSTPDAVQRPQAAAETQIVDERRGSASEGGDRVVGTRLSENEFEERLRAIESQVGAAADRLAGTHPGRSIGGSAPAIIGIAFFGTAVGLLTALNVTTGLTATLVGLLFAFVGTTLLNWFKPAEFTFDDRRVLAGLAGGLGGGIVIGLAVGFASKVSEELWIRPTIIDRASEQARVLDAKLNDVIKLVKGLDPEEKPPADKWKEIAAAVASLESAPSPLVLDTPSTDPRSPRIFVLQAATADMRSQAANAASDALKFDESAAKLDAVDKALLTWLRDSLREPSWDADAFPERIRALGELIHRTPPSIHEESAETLRSFLTPMVPAEN